MAVAESVLVVAVARLAPGVAALVWLFQEKLIFYPQPSPRAPPPPPGWTLEEVADHGARRHARSPACS